MKAKNYIFQFSVICLLAITANTIINAKGKTVTQTKQGDSVDLTTFTTHSSGLKFKTLKAGTGSKPYAGEFVTVDYTGWLHDNGKIGKKFDSSVDRGQTFQFKLGAGQVIKGWDFTLADMKIGEKRLVIIPAELGYGNRGAGAVIPPNATLVFEIDLHGAQ